MTTKEKNKLISSALKFVNAVRTATGRKPLVKMPKGYRKEPNSCPIASGINTKYKAGVTGDSFSLEGISEQQSVKIISSLKKNFALDGDCAGDFGRYEFDAPFVVEEFVRAFDDGDIPELDKDLVSSDEEE